MTRALNHDPVPRDWIRKPYIPTRFPLTEPLGKSIRFDAADKTLIITDTRLLELLRKERIRRERGEASIPQTVFSALATIRLCITNGYTISEEQLVIARMGIPALEAQEEGNLK